MNVVILYFSYKILYVTRLLWGSIDPSLGGLWLCMLHCVLVFHIVITNNPFSWASKHNFSSVSVQIQLYATLWSYRQRIGSSLMILNKFFVKLYWCVAWFLVHITLQLINIISWIPAYHTKRMKQVSKEEWSIFQRLWHSPVEEAADGRAMFPWNPERPELEIHVKFALIQQRLLRLPSPVLVRLG